MNPKVTSAIAFHRLPYGPGLGVGRLKKRAERGERPKYALTNQHRVTGVIILLVVLERRDELIFRCVALHDFLSGFPHVRRMPVMQAPVSKRNMERSPLIG